MRVILDECLPRKLGPELVGHNVTTVQKEGWSGILNGWLLAQIAGKFDAFITVDKNLPAQQETNELSFGVIVLRAPSNRLKDLRPLVPQLLSALTTITPGKIAVVAAPGF
jgi:hypothetical protein